MASSEKLKVLMQCKERQCKQKIKIIKNYKDYIDLNFHINDINSINNGFITYIVTSGYQFCGQLSVQH